MCLGLSLRTGGGDLIIGGDSAGEVFSEYTFNLVNSLIFLLPGNAYSFALAEMLVMLANNCSPPPLALEARNQLKKP